MYEAITLYELNNYMLSNGILLSEVSTSSLALKMKWKPK